MRNHVRSLFVVALLSLPWAACDDASPGDGGTGATFDLVQADSRRRESADA